jgi:hypothetical protein
MRLLIAVLFVIFLVGCGGSDSDKNEIVGTEVVGTEGIDVTPGLSSVVG